MAKKTTEDVPNDEVGEFVQLHIDTGKVKKITIPPNDDEATCTVTVEK